MKRCARGFWSLRGDQRVAADERAPRCARRGATMRARSRMIEYSISACSMTASSEIEVYGPDERVARSARACRSRRARGQAALEHGALPITTRPSSTTSSPSMPSQRDSMVSSTRRFASSMSSRRPVSFHQPVTTCGRTRQAAIDEVLDRVGDLELAARRGLDRLDRLPDRVGEHVHADEREVGLRLLRLLDEPGHAAVGVELGDAERARVRHVLQQDQRVGPIAARTPRRAR